jgi:hypothetical protein
MVTEMELFVSADLTALDLCLWALLKSEVYKIKVDTQDELLVDIWMLLPA